MGDSTPQYACTAYCVLHTILVVDLWFGPAAGGNRNGMRKNDNRERIDRTDTLPVNACRPDPGACTRNPA
eukprot:1975229-Prymnesium_polylepis.1